MTIKEMKQMIQKNIYLKSALGIVLIIVIILYIKIFSAKGIVFDQAFLKKIAITSSEVHYKGENRYGPIEIIVKEQRNSIGVSYQLPNGTYKQYTVEFTGEEVNGMKSVTIHNQEGREIFNGKYRSDSWFLLDFKGEPFWKEGNIELIVNGQSPYDSDYKVDLKNVVDCASQANERIRGEYRFVVLAFILFLFTSVDMKYPMFFFTLNNFLSVKDPEPSDFYLSMQKFLWIAIPVIGCILLIAALNPFNILS